MADEAAQMLEDCEARESKLSEWEQQFVANCADQLQRGRDLSQKQHERLSMLWDRVTG